MWGARAAASRLSAAAAGGVVAAPAAVAAGVVGVTGVRAGAGAGYHKETTGLVGLKVEPNSRALLAAISAKILKDVAAHIPPGAAYRTNVEAVYKHRLKVCQDNEDAAEIERILGVGQMEELLEMAKDEEKLIPFMAGARAAPLPRPPATPAGRGKRGARR